ncbi:MAG: hypothetical protein IJ002_08920 [Clostridia bacterium]|nr:hypothetical protein [Clostridia bacterium]
MKSMQSAVKISAPSKKALEITKFYGFNRGKLADGLLLDAENVTVLSDGALCSVLKESEVDVVSSARGPIEGVYTYNENNDPEYETLTTAEWVYENICPESVLGYEKWHTAASRVMIKDIGMPPKTADGYRKVISAFSDGEKTFVFYEACYNMLDERRQAEMAAVGSGFVWTFYSGEDGAYSGSINIYLLTQLFLDVIDGGSVTTTLIDARLDHIKEITQTKYQYTTLISEDGETYKYASNTYAPTLGESYKLYFDRVYTGLYADLENYKADGYISYSKKSLVRYCNINGGDGDFRSAGEKMLMLPEKRLLSRSGGVWSLSEEACDTMPTFSAAVQQFDRLFGICDDTVYASVKGDCTDFTLAEENEPASGAWKMVTADIGGFTAIAAFGGRVAVFTEKTMMTVRGTELPFTLSHVADCGCISQDAVAVCDGALYFISEKGVMRYSGSSISRISDPLPRGTDYSMAKLTVADGVLVMSLGDLGQLWFYEPSSEQWSRLSLCGDSFTLAGDTVLIKSADCTRVYTLFDEFGEFSFVLGLCNRGRRRIKSITVTAEVGIDSELCLYDKNGNVLLSVYSPETSPVSRTYLARGVYADHGALRFGGSGDVTLYGVRIEYADVKNTARKIK